MAKFKNNYNEDWLEDIDGDDMYNEDDVYYEDDELEEFIDDLYDHEEEYAIEMQDCLTGDVSDIDFDDGNLYIAVTLLRRNVLVRFTVDGSEYELTPSSDFLYDYEHMIKEGTAEMGTGVLCVREDLADAFLDAFGVTSYYYRHELWTAIVTLDNVGLTHVIEEQEMM